MFVHIWETNQAGFQNTPVTLCDNTNKGGGLMLGLLLVHQKSGFSLKISLKLLC